jgi:hypothetical protein
MSGNLAVSPMSAQPLRTANSGANSRLSAEQRAGLVQEIIDTQNKAVQRLVDKINEFCLREKAYTCEEIKKWPLGMPLYKLYIMADQAQGEYRTSRVFFYIDHVQEFIRDADKTQKWQALCPGEKVCVELTISRCARRILTGVIKDMQHVIGLIDRIEYNGGVEKCTDYERKVTMLTDSHLLRALMIEVVNDYRKEIADGKYKPELLTNDRIWRFVKTS